MDIHNYIVSNNWQTYQRSLCTHIEPYPSTTTKSLSSQTSNSTTHHYSLPLSHGKQHQTNTNSGEPKENIKCLLDSRLHPDLKSGDPKPRSNYYSETHN